MSNSPDAFSYRPLSRDSFENLRLIYLHPGGFDDMIYCTIYHANILDRRPQTEYIALSYVWGDATQTHPIQLCYHQLSTSETACTWPSVPSPGVDRYKPFQATTNLEKALRHLRDRTSERILWVDAICINQSDSEEKLSQIQFMQDVYSNAVEVRIWLGSLSDVQDVVKEDTKAFVSCERRDIEIALLAAKDYVMNEDRLPGQEADHKLSPDELQALGMYIIAMQPWWRRVWVIQEATTSEQDPVMQCGDLQLGYRKFLEKAKRHMVRDALSTLSRTQTSLIVHGLFDDDYDPYRISATNRLLTCLDYMSGNFKVSKPEDRINGVHGLLFRTEDSHDNFLFSLIKEQREQEHYKFFHRIAIWILLEPRSHSYSLRILESGPSNVEGVPSWVPMWTSKKWNGESKLQGAPESRYTMLSKGVAMDKTYSRWSFNSPQRREAVYRQKLSEAKSLLQCTEIRIYDALALGQIITTLKILPVPGREDTDVLRKAVLQVEEEILAALRLMRVRHADAKTHIQRFEDYLHINFWDTVTGEGSFSSKHSATLEDFLQREKETKKSTRRPQASAHQANLNVSSPSSIAKLRSFFAHSRDIVVGSKIVGHIFEDEDSPPCWQSGDKLYLIPECRWVLGLRRNGSGYQYMYRVFISDLAWQQRKQMFDDKGVYENIVLV
ncbi:hypothetical protein AA0120_g2721 [Alternaria tenuissima]|nr:hypothetical protein AA0120_g2721 [Alternaria tenuissima]